jgi:hypothetical protein
MVPVVAVPQKRRSKAKPVAKAASPVGRRPASAKPVLSLAPPPVAKGFNLLDITPDFQLPLLKDVAKAKVTSTSTSDLPYWGMIQNRFVDVQQEARCFAAIFDKLVAEKLPTGRVLEVFGGVGMSALLLRKRVKIAEHYLDERDPECLKQLRALFKDVPGVSVHEVKDWTEVPVPKRVSGVVLDFNSFTALQYLRSEKLRAALGKIFEAKPAWIVMTDSAISKFHINLPYYKKEEGLNLNGGKRPTYDDYVAAFSKVLSRAVGYKISHWQRHRRAGYFLLTRHRRAGYFLLTPK